MEARMLLKPYRCAVSHEKVGSALEKAIQEVFYDTPNIKNFKKEDEDFYSDVQIFTFKVENEKYFAKTRDGGQCELSRQKYSEAFCEFYYTPSGHAVNIKFFDVD